jgi:glycosyltransferase involved in cell wall biosynthesis
MKLLFLVNGSSTSAAGIRAQEFAKRLPCSWIIQLRYRPVKKWVGIGLFLHAALKLRPDIIYVMDTAYTGILSAAISKLLLRCKFITDTGDVAFELAKSRGIYSRTQLVLIKWIENLAIYYSDYLIVRGSYHKVWLATQGLLTVEFIPDGVNLSVIQPVQSSSLKYELGLADSLVIGLIGSMHWSEKHNLCYGWEVIEVINLLKQCPIKGLLIGDGNGRSKLEERAKTLGVLERVIFVGEISFEDIPNYLSLIDVCISTQSNDLVGNVRTTGKLPLYLACGKYIIASDVGEAHNVLSDLGFLVPYKGVRDDDYPHLVAKHLESILEQPEILEVSSKARDIARQYFDYDILTTKVENLCRTLGSNP